MSALYNSGYNGRFDRYGRPVRASAKQEWAIGNVVNVGFLKGLTITSFNPGSSEYTLVSAKGKKYGFQPHLGIFAL